MKNILLIIGGLVIIGILIWYFGFRNQNKPSTSPTAASNENQTSSSTLQSGEIKISGFQFSPSEIEIAKGAKIIWTNEESTPHTVVSDNNKFSSQQLSKGQSFEFTFSDTGEYPYHCSLHPEMKAKIIVK